jgi:hypothetical protein
MTEGSLGPRLFSKTFGEIGSGETLAPSALGVGAFKVAHQTGEIHSSYGVSTISPVTASTTTNAL